MEYLKKLGFYFGLALALIGSIASIPGGIVYDLGEYLIKVLGFRRDE